MPTQYVHTNGHTYSFYTVPMTWGGAQNYCNSLGGHLATIPSADVQAFIETFIAQPAWIGAYNNGTDWEWVTGETWGDYTHWAAGQPDNPGTEPYVQIGVGTNWAGGYWNNWTAGATLNFICEWDKDLTAPETVESETPSILPQISSAPIKPFILRARIKPTDTEKVEIRFYDDNFQPDFEIPARLNTVRLIKGTAIQLNRPSNSLHIIQIGNGIFLHKKDFILFNQIYHINLIGEPEPYPTEYLVVREEDFELVLPNGYTYNVTFAEAPNVEPIKIGRGEWTYTLRCKFRIVSDEDEQAEL